MTLADFYATHASPQAIIVPRRSAKANALRRASGSAEIDTSSLSTAMPLVGSAEKKH